MIIRSSNKVILSNKIILRGIRTNKIILNKVIPKQQVGRIHCLIGWVLG